jgi:hypothetical protein
MRKIFGSKLWLIPAVFCGAAFAYLSCDVGTFPPATPYHPPLGLVLDSTNSGEIYMEFWAYNDEDYFAGYNIYMAPSVSQVEERKREDCLLNQHGRLPSLISQPSSDVVEVKNIIITRDPVGAPLAPNSIWYITVSSYDDWTETDSRLGEVKEVTVQP